MKKISVLSWRFIPCLSLKGKKENSSENQPSQNAGQQTENTGSSTEPVVV